MVGDLRHGKGPLALTGIEVRGLGKEISTFNMQPFSEGEIDRTVRTLADLRLSIPCLSSGIALKFADKRAANIAELTDYIHMAARLGAPYVRVMGDWDAAPGGEVDDEAVKSQLRELIPEAEKCGVTLLVETNGVYANTERLRDLLTDLASDNVAALWDMHHPYRFMHESPEQTLQNLGTYIKHVHIKDSVLEDGKLVYRLMGDGDLPIDEMMRALRSINYEGYVTLEWVRYWSRDMYDAGVVFPQFLHYMEAYLDKPVADHKLYTAHTGLGQYVWPHNQLLDLTFPQVLDRMVEEFPDQVCFDYTELDYKRTYSQFRDDVDEFARALIGMGVKRGDHVAIWATNVPAWYITFWATTKIGAVLVTVNTAYKIHEAEYLLRQSDTHTLVMIDGFKDSDYIGIVRELCPELAGHDPRTPLHAKRLPLPAQRHHLREQAGGLLLLGGGADHGRARAGAGGPAARHEHRQARRLQHAVHLRHHGLPQGRHAHALQRRQQRQGHRRLHGPLHGGPPDDPGAHVHCFGMVLAMTAAMTHGASMYPITAFSPRKGLHCINEKQITAFHGVPTMFIAMLEHPNFEKTDFSHMRTGIMAGSPCPIKVMQDVIDKMHMSEICITYGQTEASPATTMSKITDPLEVRVNTVGGPIFGVECKVVDPETGEDLPDNQDGEFLARGYNIMKGYYKMPTATAAAIDKDGWLHSGDLARRDENGRYKITGRIKDMIIRGGENIYPKEIEDFIYTHPKVKDVQVIGVPSKDYGEEIMACVILKDGETMTEEEVKDFVRTHMAKHKVPRYVEFVKEFPMNAAGKILKYKMREAAVQKLSLQAAEAIETA